MFDPDTHNTDMPVCPYCGHQMTCAADLLTQDGLTAGDGVALCQACEREFKVTLHIEYRYSTRKDA
jgi:transcription elongation factor Elf1